jgi:hypothetical protein
MTPEQRQKLIDFLGWQMMPEQKQKLIDFLGWQMTPEQRQKLIDFLGWQMIPEQKQKLIDFLGWHRNDKDEWCFRDGRVMDFGTDILPTNFWPEEYREHAAVLVDEIFKQEGKIWQEFLHENLSTEIRESGMRGYLILIGLRLTAAQITRAVLRTIEEMEERK